MSIHCHRGMSAKTFNKFYLLPNFLLIRLREYSEPTRTLPLADGSFNFAKPWSWLK